MVGGAATALAAGVLGARMSARAAAGFILGEVKSPTNLAFTNIGFLRFS
jgi:hypothetical protein